MTSHVHPVEALRGSNRSVRGGGSLAQKSLVIAQAAMSLALLSAAALLGQSVRDLEHQRFGFEPKNRYLVSINPTLGNYKPERMEPFFRRIDDWDRVMPGFFETLGAKIVRGRSLEEQDTATTHPIAVVSEAFVRRFFKHQNPMGQHFGMGRIQYAGKLEIIGVVRTFAT